MNLTASRQFDSVSHFGRDSLLPGQENSHGAIIKPILLAELFQGFVSEFQILSNGHGYSRYNHIFEEMSRKIRKGLIWGKILRQFRKEAYLTQEEMADLLGYKKTGKGQPKGDISLIETGKVPINEEKLRLWVSNCGKLMTDFYAEVTRIEVANILLNSTTQPQAKKK